MYNISNLLAGEINNTFMWIFLIVAAVLLVVLNIFATKKAKKRQQEEMQKREEKCSSIKEGDKILTIGMIYGTVVEVCEDGSFVLETGSEAHKGYIRINKEAIYSLGQDGNEPTNPNDDVFPETSTSNEQSADAEKAEVNTEEKTENKDEFSYDAYAADDKKEDDNSQENKD